MTISNTEMSHVFISSHSDGKEQLVQGTNKAKGFQSKRKGGCLMGIVIMDNETPS